MKLNKIKPFIYESAGKQYNPKQIRDLIMKNIMIEVYEDDIEITKEFLIQLALGHNLHRPHKAEWHLLDFLVRTLDELLLYEIISCGDLENYLRRTK
jgi:hypothetical protein